MKIISKTGNDDIAVVYIADIDGKKIEFVESVQPPVPRSEKWVMIISTLFGCPVKCKFCDAGNFFSGKLTEQQLLDQIEFMIKNRFDNNIDTRRLKIQFARMGEPALNQHVISVLETLPQRYPNVCIMPSISTIAPYGTDVFFQDLLAVKQKYYQHSFQLQFSIHTTDETLRDWLIPVKKWSFSDIASYAREFYVNGDRKITLNFALGKNMPLDASCLLHYFSPELFLVKITPVNPTYNAHEHNIDSYILPEERTYEIIDDLEKHGYDVIVSIGELQENHIGSNCGQYITNFMKTGKMLENSYTYEVEQLQ